MISFAKYISEENKTSVLGDFIRVGTNMPDADFWIHRRHSAEQVGHPTRVFNKEHFGVKITNPALDPRYAFYMMQHIANSGHYRQYATGITNLVNIKKHHITNIPISMGR